MAREFKRKPYSATLYKWKVIEADPNKERRVGNENLMNKKRERFCDAEKGNKFGEDWFTTYVYNEVIDNKGIKHRYAYVACDYVK